MHLYDVDHLSVTSLSVRVVTIALLQSPLMKLLQNLNTFEQCVVFEDLILEPCLQQLPVPESQIFPVDSGC